MLTKVVETAFRMVGTGGFENNPTGLYKAFQLLAVTTIERAELYTGQTAAEMTPALAEAAVKKCDKTATMSVSERVGLTNAALNLNNKGLHAHVEAGGFHEVLTEGLMRVVVEALDRIAACGGPKPAKELAAIAAELV